MDFWLLMTLAVVFAWVFSWVMHKRVLTKEGLPRYDMPWVMLSVLTVAVFVGYSSSAPAQFSQVFTFLVIAFVVALIVRLVLRIRGSLSVRRGFFVTDHSAEEERKAQEQAARDFEAERKRR